MANKDQQKKAGWLNKKDTAASNGISVQAFDKWGVQPVAKIGRESFYTMECVVENRVAQALRKQQLTSDLDPEVEAKLMQERLRLTAAQADAQEMKNMVSERAMVPVGFAVFALSRTISSVAAKLDTVPLLHKRKHPDLDVRHIESLQRDIAEIRNAAADLADDIPDLIDEYCNTLEG